jgi:hypothetical protein
VIWVFAFVGDVNTVLFRVVVLVVVGRQEGGP